METRGGGAQARILRHLPAAALMLLPGVFLHRTLGAGKTVFGHDLATVFWYTRAWTAGELLHGRLPVWDPHVLCGFPLLAAAQAAVFYPATWLGAVLPDAVFWVVTTWVHLALAGLFATAWLRRGLRLDRRAALVGGAMYALTGFLFAHLYAGHVNYVWAYPWAAAVCWRVERMLAAPTVRRAVVLSLATALMILAGVPQLVFVTGLAVAARLAHFVLEAREGRRRRLRSAVGVVAAMVASLLVAAPQLLPTFELARETQRPSLGQGDFTTSYSMPPENLALLVAPGLFGDSARTPYWGRWYLWEVFGYAGVTALALAGAGLASGHRQRWLWLGIAGGGVLLALGRYTPAFDVFERIVPGASLFRGPGRYLLLLCLAIPALAAMGLDRVLAAEPRDRGIRIAGLATVAAALVLSAAWIWVETRPDDGPGSWQSVLEAADLRRKSDQPETSLPLHDAAFQSVTKLAATSSLASATGWAVLSASLLWMRGIGRLKAGSATILLSLAGVIEPSFVASRYVESMESGPLEWPPQTREFLSSRAKGPFRLASAGPSAPGDPGRARVAGMDHIGGYEPMLLRRYADLIRAVSRSPSTAVVVATPHRPHPVLAMMGARVWVVPPGYPRNGFEPIGDLDNEQVLLERQDALPRAWIASRAVRIPEERLRLKQLARPDWNPAETVVLEDGPEPLEENAAGVVAVTSFGPGWYRLEAETPTGGWLVLSEAGFPGWEAEVGGSPAEIRRANHLLMAVRVPAGKHEVIFRYRSRLLPAGFALAGFAALVPAGLALRRRISSRSPSAASD